MSKNYNAEVLKKENKCLKREIKKLRKYAKRVEQYEESFGSGAVEKESSNLCQCGGEVRPFEVLNITYKICQKCKKSQKVK